MSYLLDTNILSELRKPHGNPNVLRWADQIDPDDCYISVLALGEICRGIDLIRHRDPAKAKTFERWLNTLASSYAERILSIDVETALKWGKISAVRNLSPIDALLGATAAQHGLTMVTRNVADFTDTGIDLMNPFEFES